MEIRLKRKCLLNMHNKVFGFYRVVIKSHVMSDHSRFLSTQYLASVLFIIQRCYIHVQELAHFCLPAVRLSEILVGREPVMHCPC